MESELIFPPRSVRRSFSNKGVDSSGPFTPGRQPEMGLVVSTHGHLDHPSEQKATSVHPRSAQRVLIAQDKNASVDRVLMSSVPTTSNAEALQRRPMQSSSARGSRRLSSGILALSRAKEALEKVLCAIIVELL